jgi:hypothetical protein
MRITTTWLLNKLTGYEAAWRVAVSADPVVIKSAQPGFRFQLLSRSRR